MDAFSFNKYFYIKFQRIEYMKYFGFIYQWHDTKKDLKYIGSHYGTLEDGYVCSSAIMLRAYTKRKSDFKRTILEYIEVDDKKILHIREQFYLDTISNDELYTSENKKNKTIKYYNMKKHATGGNGGLGSNGALTGKKKYYNEKGEQRFFIEGQEPIGWIKGVPDDKKSGTGKVWYTNIKTGERKRSNLGILNEDWVAGREYSDKLYANRVKVHTPNGTFESQSDASRYYKVDVHTIRNRCNSKTSKWNEWYFTKE